VVRQGAEKENLMMYQQQAIVEERKRRPVVRALAWGIGLYAARFVLCLDSVLDATYNLAIVPILVIDILLIVKVVVPLLGCFSRAIRRGPLPAGPSRPEPIKRTPGDGEEADDHWRDNKSLLRLRAGYLLDLKHPLSINRNQD
jgi:hypothetical protein